MVDLTSNNVQLSTKSQFGLRYLRSAGILCRLRSWKRYCPRSVMIPKRQAMQNSSYCTCPPSSNAAVRLFRHADHFIRSRTVPATTASTTSRKAFAFIAAVRIGQFACLSRNDGPSTKINGTKLPPLASPYAHARHQACTCCL